MPPKSCCTHRCSDAENAAPSKAMYFYYVKYALGVQDANAYGVAHYVIATPDDPIALLSGMLQKQSLLALLRFNNEREMHEHARSVGLI